MGDWKLYGKCTACKLKRFFLRKPTVQLPIGIQARGRELVCGRCEALVRANIK